MLIFSGSFSIYRYTIGLTCARRGADSNLCDKGGEKVPNKNLVQIYSNDNGNNTNNALAVNKVIFQEEDEIVFQTCCLKGLSHERNGTWLILVLPFPLHERLTDGEESITQKS